MLIEATTITYFIIIPTRSSKKDDVGDRGNKKRGRQISFTSVAMTMSSFYKNTNIINPMIQISIAFNNISDYLEEDSVVSLVYKLIFFERMECVSRGNNGSHN